MNMLTPEQMKTAPDWGRVLNLLDESVEVFDLRSRVLKAVEQCAQFQVVALHKEFRGQQDADVRIRERAADLVLMGLQMLRDHSATDEQMWEMLNHKLQRHDQRLRMLSRTPGALDAGVTAASE